MASAAGASRDGTHAPARLSHRGTNDSSGAGDDRQDSPASAAQIAQERPDPDDGPSTVSELHQAAQAALYGYPGTQVDGQTVTSMAPLEGLRALRRLRELVDALEVQLVAKCRERQLGRWGYYHRELHSWAEISDAVGIPKNTLHRRYGPGGSG